jgi:orotate phosphoribosyltransferase-like protein
MKLHAETKIEIFLGFSNCKLKTTTMHSTEMKTSMAIYNGEEEKNTYSPKMG